MLAAERLIIVPVTRPGEGENHASAGESYVVGGGSRCKNKKKNNAPDDKTFSK